MASRDENHDEDNALADNASGLKKRATSCPDEREILNMAGKATTAGNKKLGKLFNFPSPLFCGK